MASWKKKKKKKEEGRRCKEHGIYVVAGRGLTKWKRNTDGVNFHSSKHTRGRRTMKSSLFIEYYSPTKWTEPHYRYYRSPHTMHKYSDFWWKTNETRRIKMEHKLLFEEQLIAVKWRSRGSKLQTNQNHSKKNAKWFQLCHTSQTLRVRMNLLLK